MTKDRRLAGLGGIAFAVAMIVGFTLADPPGGSYHAADVEDFVASDHSTLVFVSLYLVLAATVGLVVLAGHLAQSAFAPGLARRSFWGLALASATSFFAGWTIVLAPASARAIGGGPAIDPVVAYTIGQAGFGVMLVGGGVLLGVALLVLTLAGGGAPTWFRAVACVAGLLGLATPAFFPFFALLLFALVAGIWLLVSRADDPAPSPAA